MNYIKKASVALVTSAALLGGTALLAPVAFADSTPYHFTASGSLNSATSSPGSTMKLNLTVTETNADNAGGENHVHYLPPKLTLVFTETGSGETKTFNSTATLDSQNPDTGMVDQLNQTISGVYTVNVPANVPDGHVTVSANSTPTFMFFPKNSADSDDPIKFGDPWTLNIVPLPSGDLPEVPYAGLLPLVALAAVGGFVIYRRRTKHN